MYSLPDNFDSSFLVGKFVESICFAAYQVNLHFSGDLTLQIEGGYELHALGNLVENVDSFPIASSALLGVIGDCVKSVQFDLLSGDMVIQLGKGASVHLNGDSGQYESYRLMSKDSDIII